jgi:hypothetical protein
MLPLFWILRYNVKMRAPLSVSPKNVQTLQPMSLEITPFASLGNSFIFMVKGKGVPVL